MEATSENTKQLVERLREELDELNEHTKEQFQLSLSVGTTRYVGEDVMSLDALLARADAAMYAEKRDKRRAMVP
jgi:GGDEF domain-containing protein